MSEIRLAMRRLARRPTAAAAAVATLACAIAAAAATWALLSAVLLRPLNVASPDRVVVMGERDPSGKERTLQTGHIYPVYTRVLGSGFFDGVAGGGVSSLLVGVGGRSLQQRVYFASDNLFTVLGLTPALGRMFTADDNRPGAPLVALLSERYWRTTFDGDPGVIGRVVTVSRKPVTIIGVAPRRFRGLNLADAPDLYLPLNTVADVGSRMTNYFATSNHPSSPTAWVAVIARLRPDTTAGQGEARLNALLGASARHKVVALTDVNTAAIPEASRPAMRQFARLLSATVGLLLLIGCTTVGMLLLIRTEARRGEFAMCLALGASRGRLVAGVVVEGVLLALAGAALAVPLAKWLFAAVRTFDLPGGVALDLLELGVDARLLAGAACCAAVAVLLIASVAAIFGFSGGIADTLRSSAGATPRGRRTRTLLVTGQVAVAMVLLGGTVLFARSVIAALSLNPGFDTSRIITGSLSLGRYGYTPAREAQFLSDLRDRLGRNPAVQSVALIEPWGGMASGGRLVIDGEPRRCASTVAFTAVDQHYFGTLGVKVVRGRDFGPDDRKGSTLVAIVSESFGRALANGGNPIGRRIAMPYSRIGQPPDTMQVVGLVPDLIRDVAVLEPLVMYTPLAQSEEGSGSTFVVRAAGSAAAARREILTAIRRMDPAVTPSPLLTIDERLAAQMGPQRFGALVMGALGFIAILLTLVGAYVAAESAAVARRREMAVRAALGARSARLALTVLAQTIRLVGAGLLCGLGLAWIGANTIRALLYHVQPLDPATLGSVAALILVLSLVVSVKPALQVARLDLNRVLREE